MFWWKFSGFSVLKAVWRSVGLEDEVDRTESMINRQSINTIRLEPPEEFAR